MGKIVKYCSSCEESFAEKFSFCPNCASELSAYEMKPVAGNGGEASVADEKPAREESPAETNSPAEKTVPEAITPEPVTKETIFEPVDLLADAPREAAVLSDDFEIELPLEDTVSADADLSVQNDGGAVAEESDEEVVETPEPAETAPALGFTVPEPVSAAGRSSLSEDYLPARGGDDAYAVTVISERNTTTRNGLLLGSFALIISGFFGVLVFSLFNNLDDIPALEPDPNLIAYLNDTPIQIEEAQKTDSKDDKPAGGGGGGGKNEPTPASEGVRPPMMRTPIIAPSSRMTRVTNPEIPIQAGIQGPIDEKKRIPGRYGVPGSLNPDDSDGGGSGGGIGSGRGRGVGPGTGGGFGPGSNGGMGGGDNGGIGPGSGGGGGTRPTRRNPPASGPSSQLQILSKPRPGYTEAARKANLTGTVRVRVTFNANGTIGSVTPITRLGHGLTEKAIAAARSITFKPEMRNGRPVGVKKTIAYNFSIY
ncbi:MAG: energy transducer TonB [Acidobacteriota bacterium]|nr:energy transducer TonB [Acidobacteriota bacterium]MDH3530567.1 energy transducer TonB [Acidobacteriota bacterium]